MFCLFAWWKMEESAILLAQTITENDCATRVEAFPIWSIDKFLYPLKWVQDFDYISELGSCLGSLNGRSRRSTTSISISEPPGWDWRGSKMAVLKYLICGPSWASLGLPPPSPSSTSTLPSSFLQLWGSSPVVQMAYLPLRPNLFCLKSDQKKKNRFEILEW